MRNSYWIRGKGLMLYSWDVSSSKRRKEIERVLNRVCKFDEIVSLEFWSVISLPCIRFLHSALCRKSERYFELSPSFLHN